MRPHVAASQGIAPTFQNVALFKGMSTLDNIMAGRTLKMTGSITSGELFRHGPAMREEIEHRRMVEESALKRLFNDLFLVKFYFASLLDLYNVYYLIPLELHDIAYLLRQ